MKHFEQRQSLTVAEADDHIVVDMSVQPTMVPLNI
jgi:hypothetical protein